MSEAERQALAAVKCYYERDADLLSGQIKYIQEKHPRFCKQSYWYSRFLIDATNFLNVVDGSAFMSADINDIRGALDIKSLEKTEGDR